MGFFSNLGQSLQKGLEKVGEIILDTSIKACEWTREALETVKEVTVYVVESVSNKFDEWGEKLRERKNKPKPSIYRPEPVESQLLNDAKKLLDEHFPTGIKSTLETQSEEQRLQTFEEVAMHTAQVYGLKNSPEIKFFAPSTLEESFLYGSYNRRENTLNLNVEMIVSDSMNVVEEQVYTIFHEMIHARQWEAVMELAEGKVPGSYGYSLERIVEYANNFKDYISPQENAEAYEKQPLERDAFGFERTLRNQL